MHRHRGSNKYRGMQALRRAVRLAAVIALALQLSAGAVAAAEIESDALLEDPPGVYAEYHGAVINLAEGWQEAAACAVTEAGNRCFDSEAEMDAWLDTSGTERVTASSGDDEVGIMATCSSSTRLYSGTDWSGDVLHLSSRGIWMNLSSYGFDNRTSSYKIGACSAIFRESANGGGSTYPGDTSANAAAGSMVSGWNNRVSSVYIH